MKKWLRAAIAVTIAVLVVVPAIGVVAAFFLYPDFFETGRGKALVAGVLFVMAVLASVQQVLGLTIAEVFRKPKDRPILEVSFALIGVSMGCVGFAAYFRNVGSSHALDIRAHVTLDPPAPRVLVAPNLKAKALPPDLRAKLEFVFVDPLTPTDSIDRSCRVMIQVTYTDLDGREYAESESTTLGEIFEEDEKEALRSG